MNVFNIFKRLDTLEQKVDLLRRDVNQAYQDIDSVKSQSFVNGKLLDRVVNSLYGVHSDTIKGVVEVGLPNGQREILILEVENVLDDTDTQLVRLIEAANDHPRIKGALLKNVDGKAEDFYNDNLRWVKWIGFTFDNIVCER